MISERVLIQKKGQLTIPVALRRKYDLEEGGVVELIEEENGFRIIPRFVLAEEALDEVGKILKKKGISLNQLISGGREIRKDIFREKYTQEQKAPVAVETFMRFIGALDPQITEEPSEKEVEEAGQYINPEDAIVLAAAIKAKTDYFVTLDKRHFLKDPRIEKQAKLKILSPRQFLKGD